MRFSIIIVHYNGVEHLRSCLISLPQTEEVIVLDNASTQDLSALKGEFQNVRWILNDENVGYGSAANLGARQATGEWLLVLNQDIVLQANSLEKLSEDIELQPEVGIWGAQLKNPDGTDQHSTGPFPTLLNWLWRLRLPKKQRKYYLDPPEAGTTVDWATGAFLCIKGFHWAALGGFDDGYFMYYEDTDLCKRAEMMGILVATSNAEAMHSAPLSERGNPSDALAQHIRYSQLRYFKAHRPAVEFLLLKVITKVYFKRKGWKFRGAYL